MSHIVDTLHDGHHTVWTRTMDTLECVVYTLHGICDALSHTMQYVWQDVSHCHRTWQVMDNGHDTLWTHVMDTHHRDGVATIRRLLKMIGLFCRIQSFLYGSFAKETFIFKEPTNWSHPILSVMGITHYGNTPWIHWNVSCMYTLHVSCMYTLHVSCMYTFQGICDTLSHITDNVWCDTLWILSFMGITQNRGK